MKFFKYRIIFFLLLNLVTYTLSDDNLKQIMQAYGLNSYAIKVEMNLVVKTADGLKMADYNIFTGLSGEYVECK